MMDHTQFAYFKDRYSRMSDEELANLFVTRRDHLSEEADLALRQVLSGKNISEFVREANATVDDLNSQAAAAAEAIDRQIAANRQIPRALAIVGIAAAVIFSAVALFRALT
jgi:tRNA threonylcarbamoyladenosine modification (KEOPS) complex Cgi121 subunit